MPPIESKGEIAGYYAENGSDEFWRYAGDPSLRGMPARTYEGEDLDFTLFVSGDGSPEPAASTLLNQKGIINVMVNFIRPDATMSESGSYSVRLHRG